ncbi:Major royal jelly protein [Enhydrobacter aerosaccus]|uniref:Major royal jelly protein n=1 Tax=Enhydrobacter aerosaccus TaxID=225324 RepID=A0A1T4T126_9HYPH|nr:L-dopachrome tautomerase-related protein [Enhydrobacter aerosaccus]SKA34186.1 Major royal jelly protein [Enhydrobacter aerosaccus]
MATALTRRSFLAAGTALGFGGPAAAQKGPPDVAARPSRPKFDLQEVARFQHQVTGVAASSDGRLFVNFPRWTEDAPISVAELMRDGSLKPYPDDSWNAWRNAEAAKMQPGDHFVCVQSVVADGGNLWVLDAAAPDNEKVIANGPKLVRIELSSNKVAQIIRFGEDVALQGSYLNDVRIHPDGRTAFVTDSGARGAIVIVDLESGKSHPVLDGHPSTQPDKTVQIHVDGQVIQRPDGRGFTVGADGIAVSNDGKTLYWQPLTSRTLYSIDTATLMAADPEEAGRKVSKAGQSNVADGLLMTRDNHLYLTSLEDNSVRIWDGDRSRIVVEDPRLRWPDSLSEAPDGSLYVTASHIPDSAWFNASAPRAVPTQLFRMVRSASG